jgi:hypothetical protein
MIEDPAKCYIFRSSYSGGREEVNEFGSPLMFPFSFRKVQSVLPFKVIFLRLDQADPVSRA